jgi:hypothetical protein
MSYQIYVTITATPVYFTKCNYGNADGTGVVTVTMTASEVVDTDVSFAWTWTGVDDSIVSGTTTISSGQLYGTATVPGANAGEFVSTLSVDDPSPSSYGDQIYSNSYGDCY